MSNFELRLIPSNAFNLWQAERHYLRRPMIRSKLIAHGLFVNDALVGGLLWATPHFTKKRNLFGMGADTLDKWEVLMLARFYLCENSGVRASEALADSIGRSGNAHGRGSRRRGWRLQEDWVTQHPPVFPLNPFVPRLLISWSDTLYGHKGTIYKASGWTRWDTTTESQYRWKRKDGDAGERNAGDKTCWVMRLCPNPRAQAMGVSLC